MSRPHRLAALLAALSSLPAAAQRATTKAPGAAQSAQSSQPARDRLRPDQIPDALKGWTA